MAEPRNKRARVDLEGFTFSSGNNNVITFLYPRPQTEEERYGYNIGCKYFRLMQIRPVLPAGCELYVTLDEDNDDAERYCYVYPVTDISFH